MEKGIRNKKRLRLGLRLKTGIWDLEFLPQSILRIAQDRIQLHFLLICFNITNHVKILIIDAKYLFFSF